MSEKYNIGIIGAGFVGSAVETGFQEITNVLIHDKYKDTDSLDRVVKESEILFICLPTPMDYDTGKCDLSVIKTVIANINNIATDPKTIIIKSTVPPGTTTKLSNQYKNHYFIFNPEFLTEANFIQDFLEQDRIILGSPDNFEFFRERKKDLIGLFKVFMETQKKPADLYLTTSDEAEMCKYIINCFLATKVSFFNEMYDICQKSNINFNESVNLALKDKRIGKSHYKVPGPDGYRMFGGKCLYKDLRALTHFAHTVNVDPMLLETINSKNLLLREVYDWEEISGVCKSYKKK